MSLARLCLRLVTARLLRGRTMAEDRVRDSSIVDLEAAIKAAAQPIALVYTDDSEFVPLGRESWGGQGSASLVIVIAIAGAADLDDGSVEFRFPHTDAGIELTLDIMERQIQAAFMDPDDPWAERWRGIVVKVAKWTSKRGGSTKEGARFGARQITVECETMHDPHPGYEIEAEWRKLIDAIASDPDQDFAALAPMLEGIMEGRTMPNHALVASDLGISYDVVQKIGKGPLLDHPLDAQDEAAQLDEVEVLRDEDQAPGTGLVITEEPGPAG